MPIFTTETFLIVEPYGSFEAAAEALDDARKTFLEECKDSTGEQPTILSITFIEFDSRNITTAVAYFQVIYEHYHELDIWG